MKFSSCLEKIVRLASIASLCYLSSCAQDSPVEEPTSTGSILDVPAGTYLISDSKGQTVLSTAVVFGSVNKEVPFDTIPADSLFKPNKTIVKIESDSLWFYGNADTVTTQVGSKKEDNFMDGVIDTAEIRKAAESLGAKVEITEYTIGKPFFSVANDSLTVTEDYRVSFVYTTTAGIPSTQIIEGTFTLKGGQMSGPIPPTTWPQKLMPMSSITDGLDYTSIIKSIAGL